MLMYEKKCYICGKLSNNNNNNSVDYERVEISVGNGVGSHSPHSL